MTERRNGNKAKKEPSFASRSLERLEKVLQQAAAKGGWAFQLIHMAHLIVVGVRRSQLTRMAAALSYRTIFGIVPVLLISVLVLAAFADQNQVQKMVAQMLNFTGLSAVVAGPGQDIATTGTGFTTKEKTGKEPAGPTDSRKTSSGPDPAPSKGGAEPTAATPNPVPSSEVASEQESGPPGPAHSQPDGKSSDENVQRLAVFINGAMAKMRAIPMNTLGLIGVLVLVYAAISMLVEIEKAFNQIYNAPEGRSWVRRVTQYWTLLTLGTLFLVASFYAQERITAMAGDIHLADSYKGLFVNVLGFAITVLISTMLLVIVYMIVPNTRVQFLPALIGGFTAAVLWESGKWGFTHYVATASYSKFYGVVALVPLFMMWIYITWLIVLSGLQLASAIQTHWLTSAEGFRFSVLATFGLVDEDRAKHNVKIVDPASVLVVLTAVAERFASGKPSDHSHIAAATGIDEQAVADMLERLAGAGLLLRIADAEREGTYALARPPEAIQATEALLLAQELVGSSRAVENKVLVALTRSRVLALEGKSVADLMDKPPPPAPVVQDPAMPDKAPAKALGA